MPRINPSDGGTWGVMGGAFDPIHVGHLILAQKALKACDLMGVLFVPSYNPPHRAEKPVADFEYRLEMTGKAVADNHEFVLSDMERELQGPGYTLELLKKLIKLYPKADWQLILGADNIAMFDSWYQPDEVIKLAGILVGNRPGFEQNLKDSKWVGRIKTFEMPIVDISSTIIRGLLGKGSSIRYLVPEPVRLYISDKELYR